MAHEQFRFYGWNHGDEPERYRLHVHESPIAYGKPHDAPRHHYYNSSPGADYINRSHYPRTEDQIEPHFGSSRQSRRRNNDYCPTSDYIAPPADSRDDYISQDDDTPPRKHYHDLSTERRIPGGFYEPTSIPDRGPRNINFHEDEGINRIIKNADFSNEHEIMRAYWVPGPQEYDEMDISAGGRLQKSRPRSKSRSKAKRVMYESEVDSESDIKTYVDESGDGHGGKEIVYDSDEDEDMVSSRSGNSGRRSRSRRKELSRSEWDRSPRMPGGYASSSPSIHYESDESHTRYRSASFRSRASSRHRTKSGAPVATRYASSSPGMRYNTERSRHRSTSTSPVRPRYASTSPTRSEYGPHRPIPRSKHASPSPLRTRTRIQRAPSPPTLAQRYSSSTPSVYIGSDSEVDVHYMSDSGESGIPCRGVNRGRYVGSDVDSDFVINGGSEFDFEGDDIWCDSSHGEGGVGYDEE